MCYAVTFKRPSSLASEIGDRSAARNRKQSAIYDMRSLCHSLPPQYITYIIHGTYALGAGSIARRVCWVLVVVGLFWVVLWFALDTNNRKQQQQILTTHSLFGKVAPPHFAGMIYLT